jgi:hypothetical protein
MMHSPEMEAPPRTIGGGAVGSALAGVSDCEHSAPITWQQVKSLLNQGVPSDFLPALVNLRTVDGAVAFHEPVDEDLIFWRPRTGDLTTWAGRSFALGATDNLSSAAGALAPLRVHASPMGWLRDRGRGLVIVDWRQAFDRLRDVPGIAVDEALLPTYRAAIRPRVPKLYVTATTTDMQVAA